MKANQSGRSMVEIIGVLAIIGVLSVGAISGYSHAMEKYRWNAFTNGVNHLIMNATEISMNQKNTERVDIIPILNKTKQMPAPFDYGDSVVNQYQLHYKGYFSYAYLYSKSSTIIIEMHGIQPKICEKILIEPWDNVDWKQGILVVGSPSITFKSKPSIPEVFQYCKKATRLDLRFKIYNGNS